MKRKTERTRLIGLIHAQVHTACLDDEAYRAILYGATGEQSCSDCTVQQLQTVFADLNIVLERQHKKTFTFSHHTWHPTMRDAVTARAKKLFGENWKERLEQFIQIKIGKQSFSVCNEPDLRRIMAFLTAVERNSRK